ncbi:MAG: shikimate dehydrogenase [Phototrophicales bacterium]|nr:MAG: shikimate dehydrogenase [Phototrophicales bacterium]
MKALETPLNKQTMYFIGVTTTQSSIMKIFPLWAQLLDFDAELVGYDMPLNAPVASYRAIVNHIKHDPLAVGALVTTHKINLLEATHDLFDDLDSNARLCREVSAIIKQDGRLLGHAKDPISVGLAWQAFVPENHWRNSGGHVLCFGAGGAGIATSVFAAQLEDDFPQRFTFVDRDLKRLEKARAVHKALRTRVRFDYLYSDSAAYNDTLLERLPPGSMVINATGMGKDRPGSPITNNGLFPEAGLVWEFNYRGTLTFLQQARRQEQRRHLTIENGWVYFLHGWSQVIAEIFQIELTASLFKQLDSTAEIIRA